MKNRSLWGRNMHILFEALRLPGCATVGLATGSQGAAVTVILLGVILCGWGGLLLRGRDLPSKLSFGGITASSMPRYQLEIESADGYTALVTQPEPITKLTMDSMLSLRLRPEQRVLGAVAVRAFLRRGEKLSPWSVQPEVSRFGTFQIRAPIAELPALLPGQTELVFVVGRPQALFRSALEELLLVRPGPLPDGLQALHALIHITPGP